MQNLSAILTLFSKKKLVDIKLKKIRAINIKPNKSVILGINWK